MKIHMLGIGGSGMSALARFFLAKGYDVSGSDQNKSRITDELEEEGAKIKIGHAKENLPNGCDLVVYSCAVDGENTERKEAEKRGYETKTYFQALGEALGEYELTAVAGTHGKTTTTAMLALALLENEADPTVFVGSLVTQLGHKNFRFGKSKIAVAEACEYRMNFLNLNPTNLIITNLDYDHPDSFPDKESYRNAFRELVKKIPENGKVILPYLEEKNDWEELCRGEVIYYKKEDLPKEIKLSVPGEHNRSNASAVWRFLEEMEKAKTKKALESFEGTARRFEIIGEKDESVFISDYAHHPTEIRATLAAAREKYGNEKIVAVFQPHQFSRTRIFLEDFGKAFDLADEVLIPEIYAARDSEDDQRSVSDNDLVKEIGKHNSNVRKGGSLSETAEKLRKNNDEKRIVMLMGAGNVPEIFNLI